MSKFLGYYDFSFERSRRDGLSLRLALYEEINISDNTSTLSGRVEYKNTDEAFTENIYIEYTANGNSTSWTRSAPIEKKEEWTVYDEAYVELKTKQVGTCYHEADGTGGFTVTCTLKTDKSTILGSAYYRTEATATATGTLTAIDQSFPTVGKAVMSANRYGGNAEINLACGHSVYAITAVLTVCGLNRNQAYAWHCQPQYTENGVTVKSKELASGSDGYRLKRELIPNARTIEAVIPMYYSGDIETGLLTSGGRYDYILTVTAENGKTATVSGVLAVPQKVTGVELGDRSLTLAAGENAVLECTVLPTDSQLKGVIFESSDSDIASVSADGTVTAASEGACVVTVTSEDTGRSGDEVFSASVAITVSADTDGFPTLSETDYLGVVEISRLSAACVWLAERLGKSEEMREVSCTGRAHNVTDIRTIFEALEHNTAVLAEREEREIPRQNDNWYEIVNGWIDTLNGLRNSISN